MSLWQMDIMGGVWLDNGTEAKLVTGIDDHSRYCVVAHLVIQATGRAVCQALVEGLEAWGLPERGPDRQRGPVHRPFRQAAPGRGAVRTALAGQRDRSPPDQGPLANHHREGGAVPPDAAAGAARARGPFASLAQAQKAVEPGWRSTTTSGPIKRWPWPSQHRGSRPRQGGPGEPGPGGDRRCGPAAAHGRSGGRWSWRCWCRPAGTCNWSVGSCGPGARWPASRSASGLTCARSTSAPPATAGCSRPCPRATALMSWPCCTGTRPPARQGRRRRRPQRCRARPWSRSTGSSTAVGCWASGAASSGSGCCGQAARSPSGSPRRCCRWSATAGWSRRWRPRSRPSCGTGCRAPGVAGLPPEPAAGPVAVQRIVSQRGQIQVASQRIQVGLRHAHKHVMVLVHEDRFEVLDHGALLKSVTRTAAKEVTRFKAHEHQHEQD